MFRYGDKLTLSGINVVNKNGDIIDYHLSFPLEDTDFDIPKDVVEISIFEGHDDIAYLSFKICVGDITNIYKICEDKQNVYLFEKRAFSEIKSPGDDICYYKDSNNAFVVFSKINIGDIVVSNIEELKMVLINISNRFKCIKNSIDMIRSNDFIDYSVSDELSNKRLEMCINRRKNEG